MRLPSWMKYLAFGELAGVSLSHSVYANLDLLRIPGSEKSFMRLKILSVL